MKKKQTQVCCEKFKTIIGGQALIEGIMMRGPDKDAVVVRGTSSGELTVEVKERQLPAKNSPKNWPLIRGVRSFFDAQVTGIKALTHSAELAEIEDEPTDKAPSKFDLWLEKVLDNPKFEKVVLGFSVALGLGFSILLFILLPMVLVGFVDRWIPGNLVQHLLEGLLRMVIFVAYMVLVSKMKDIQRVFAYHGAEHKTIRCYEAGLELTVENVRAQTRLHPRCGTSFLLIVMIISIVLFSAATSVLLALIPALEAMQGTFLYRLILIVFKLLLLPLVVAVTYEINRWVGRHDNAFTRILSAPGMWMQNFTTVEPDDSMIEVGITAVKAVLPEKEGADRW